MEPDDTTTDNGLTPRQNRALLALLQHSSVRKAANACSIPESTMYLWLKLPAFASAYRQARTAMVEAGLKSLGRLLTRAVRTLRRNLECGVPAVEVRAAAVVLHHVMNGQVLADMMADVQRLREQIERPGTSSPSCSSPAFRNTAGQAWPPLPDVPLLADPIDIDDVGARDV